MTPEQAIYRAQRAKEVLDNEAYQDALEQIRSEIDNQWRTSPARDTAGRESLWLMQSLLTKLQATLETTMQTGKLKAADLEYQRKTLLSRAREFVK